MGLATAAAGKFCFSCGKWDDGVCCDETLQSEHEGQETGPGTTCPYWVEIEIREECQTCRHWVMARRRRVCGNKEVSEHGLPAKAREGCAGWSEAPSVDYVAGKVLGLFK
jgi:hypothetical protein